MLSFRTRTRRWKYLLFVQFLGALLPVSANYVGSESCNGCHQEIVVEWQQSDHFKSMQVADQSTVLGNFDNQTLIFHGITSRLFLEDDVYYINTLGKDGTHQNFEILNTFGFYPLQQYIVATEKGRLQMLNIAWDSRPYNDGGQRWFHLQPDEDISPEHPFFWANHFANWNSRCASCHSTNLEKNYDGQSKSYQTTFSEVNVACESCHGPAGNHVALAFDGFPDADIGFTTSSVKPLSWVFDKTSPIAQPKGEVSNREIDMCGGCHSRRMAIDEVAPVTDYFEHHMLETLGQGLYFPDGQIQDEVFVLGSFLQSKMHQAGVTCSNCHNPHTGKTKAEDNSLCAQCHQLQTYGSPEHHHHESDSEGAQCVNCHMPARTYMQVDDRRDHSFVVPNPTVSGTTGSPDPCLGCHSDQSSDWSLSVQREWGNKQEEHWAISHDQARRMDITSVPALADYIQDSELSGLVRATLLEQLGTFSSPEASDVVISTLTDANHLVRRAAVSSLQSTEADLRWRILAPMLRDQTRSVRLEVVRVLAPIVMDLTAKQRKTMDGGIQEYREAISLRRDTPSGQLALASLEFNLGNRGAALNAYQQALEIEPNFVPALINLADFYRGGGQESRAKSLLLRALRTAPDSAAVNHSYGLHLVRRERYAEALGYLEKGARLSDASPRYGYVYAIALDSLDRTGESVQFLHEAVEQWPNQYDLLLTLVIYLEKVGRAGEIAEPLANLRALAPQSSAVQTLLRRYPLPGT
ncbi:MAG TPA: hypothetical protein DCM54_11955 [Gammaproteobacteria bacterium]|nr:hypothetical protein [Gammaproteobacteria bacterium]